MRLIVQDLALQADKYPDNSHDIQAQNALVDLAKQGVQINLLHAEHSSLCHKVPFTQLVSNLAHVTKNKLTVITVRGKQADHGIEECRTLSTPFLIKPELYWATTLQ